MAANYMTRREALERVRTLRAKMSVDKGLVGIEKYADREALDIVIAIAEQVICRGKRDETAKKQQG